MTTTQLALPGFVRSIEGRLARDAWEKSCTESESDHHRVTNGYWQMARAIWRSSADQIDFPDNAKTAIHAISDMLRFGHPTDWSFNGAIDHLVKVSERIAQDLSEADIGKDAGFRDGLRYSTASYRDDAGKFDALLARTINGTPGGLIAFLDALIINIDTSPVARYSRAYREYCGRIAGEIARINALAVEKEASDAAAAEAAELAKYTPHEPSDIKMPTASHLEISKPKKDKPRPLLTPSGWTNGHILDLAGCPKAIKEAIGKYYGTEKIQSLDQELIDSTLRKMPAATVSVVPVSRYAGRVADRDIDAVVLSNAVNNPVVYLDRRYFAYFAATYGNCEFHTSVAGFGATRVWHDGKIVGAVMPLDIGEATETHRPKFSVPETSGRRPPCN